ncbi:MAG TPA: hypothetical protein VM326_00285 [Sphingomicrobium sp.]|nr:hypothetical protein [Sphingomicrobium sp.]
MPNLAKAMAGVAVLIAPAAAMAQWVPGSEIVGQNVQVTTNGVTNNVHLGPGGQAQITTPGGNVIPASWTAANGQLCLNTGMAQECWAYNTAFQAGQPMALTSSCGTSTWLASATNQPPPPPPPPPAGERG